jgi:hypothetical protein
MTPRDFTGDFYEDDEPVDEIVAAFESGKIELTAPDLGLSLVGATSNRGDVEPNSMWNPFGHLVSSLQVIHHGGNDALIYRS